MSGRGYQDPGKVSDAKALQLLFKTGGKGQSTIPKKRPGKYLDFEKPSSYLG
jgi:hypothetical protein